MSKEDEYSELGNFDPKMMNDSQYREMAEQARMIMANGKEIKRSEMINNSSASTKQATSMLPKQQPNQNKNTDLEEINKIPKEESDFTMQDFTDVQMFDNNSTINKMQSSQAKPINSLWLNRNEMKKYFAAKNTFKIKVANEKRYHKYRFQPIDNDQQKQLLQMADDLKNFYPMMLLEKNTKEDIEGKEQPVLIRNGQYYFKMSELEQDYRRVIADICLGITSDDYDLLEQWSDPEYTVYDIWGINDILDGIMERSINGTSYFRIAFRQL